MRKRFPKFCLTFATLLATACAGAPRREHPIYWYDTAPPAGFPETVRSVTEDRVSFAKDTERFMIGVRKASGGGTVNVLALSGGGSGAAFGAGALTGLSKAGTRPYFHVVTGVSAGALTAPFAFLGPTWDDELTESFSGQRSANLVQFSVTGLLFGSSIFRGKPLADLVNHYATEEMLQAIAVEAAKGRLLLIATTDLDSERTVIWDMGAIAMHGGPEALQLFRQVLIASASIPGLFPPVMIPVETSGTILEEMHVDGSTTATKRGIEASLHSSTRGAVLATLALQRLKARDIGRPVPQRLIDELRPCQRFQFAHASLNDAQSLRIACFDTQSLSNRFQPPTGMPLHVGDRTKFGLLVADHRTICELMKHALANQLALVGRQYSITVGSRTQFRCRSAPCRPRRGTAQRCQNNAAPLNERSRDGLAGMPAERPALE